MYLFVNIKWFWVAFAYYFSRNFFCIIMFMPPSTQERKETTDFKLSHFVIVFHHWINCPQTQQFMYIHFGDCWDCGTYVWMIRSYAACIVPASHTVSIHRCSVYTLPHIPCILRYLPTDHNRRRALQPLPQEKLWLIDSITWAYNHLCISSKVNHP